MNFIERMVLKRIMLNKLKAFAAQYPNAAHIISGVILALGLAFKTNDAFHALTLKYFAHLPADAQTLLLVIVPIVLAYFGTKDDGSGPGAPTDGPANSLPQSKASSKGNSMKRSLILVAVMLCLSFTAFAQVTTPAAPDVASNVYAAGISYNNAASPVIAGTALYAHKVNDAGTYAFTVFDALPTNAKPFTVQSNVSAGIAQKVFSIGKIPIFAPTAAGVSFNGQNTGWAWSTGALASISVKGKYRIMPGVRVIKSSVGGSGYQPIVSVLFGFAN